MAGVVINNKLSTTSSGEGWNSFSGTDIASGTSDVGNAMDWRTYLGEPALPCSTNAYENYSRGQYTLPMAYKGPIALPDIIIFNSVTQKNNFYSRIILPWTEFQNGLSITWDTLILDPAIATVTPEETTSNVVTSRMTTEYAYMERIGISMKMGWAFMATEKGRQMWFHKLKQMADSVEKAVNIRIISALLTVKNAITNVQQSAVGILSINKETEQLTISNLIRSEVAQFGCIQKSPSDAFNIMLSTYQKLLSRDGVQADGILITEGLQMYTKHCNPQTLADTSGKNAVELLGSTSEVLNFLLTPDGIVKVFVHTPIQIGSSTSAINFLQRNRTTGEWYMLDGGPAIKARNVNPKYDPMAVRIFNADLDRTEVITAREVLNEIRPMYFSADGSLHEKWDQLLQKLNDGDLEVKPEDGSSFTLEENRERLLPVFIYYDADKNKDQEYHLVERLGDISLKKVTTEKIADIAHRFIEQWELTPIQKQHFQAGIQLLNDINNYQPIKAKTYWDALFSDKANFKVTKRLADEDAGTEDRRSVIKVIDLPNNNVNNETYPAGYANFDGFSVLARYHLRKDTKDHKGWTSNLFEVADNFLKVFNVIFSNLRAVFAKNPYFNPYLDFIFNSSEDGLDVRSKRCFFDNLIRPSSGCYFINTTNLSKDAADEVVRSEAIKLIGAPLIKEMEVLLKAKYPARVDTTKTIERAVSAFTNELQKSPTSALLVRLYTLQRVLEILTKKDTVTKLVPEPTDKDISILIGSNVELSNDLIKQWSVILEPSKWVKAKISAVKIPADDAEEKDELKNGEVVVPHGDKWIASNLTHNWNEITPITSGLVVATSFLNDKSVLAVLANAADASFDKETFTTDQFGERSYQTFDWTSFRNNRRLIKHITVHKKWSFDNVEDAEALGGDEVEEFDAVDSLFGEESRPNRKRKNREVGARSQPSFKQARGADGLRRAGALIDVATEGHYGRTLIVGENVYNNINQKQRWTEIENERNDLSRIVQHVLVTLDNKYEVFQRLTQTKLPLPIKFHIKRPAIQHRMDSAILMKTGSETGGTYWGQSTFSMSDDGVQQHHISTYNVQVAAVIYQNRNVIVARDILFQGYVSGGGTTICNRSSDYDAQSGRYKKDMIVSILGADEDDPPIYHDLTGKFSISALGGNTDLYEQARTQLNHFSNALYLNEFFNFNTQQENASLGSFFTVLDHQNTILVEGFHQHPVEDGSWESSSNIVIGHAHTGTTYDGCNKVRNGQLANYDNVIYNNANKTISIR